MSFERLARLGRFKDIVLTLLEYGFDEVVQRLHLPGMDLVRKISPNARQMGTYERIRHVLEDLGPTFVKFGQIMSLRPDLVPSPLLVELTKLQDEVAPELFPHIREVVEEDLGRPLHEVFSILDPSPLAAASMSQVHRGVLKKEGTIVCVKVRRPGIRKMIETDLNILAAIVGRLHEHSAELRTYDLPGLVRVIRRNLVGELNFEKEARNMKIARAYASSSGIWVPRVYEHYCSERVVVMEYVQGTRLRDMGRGNLADPLALARQGLKAAIAQIFQDGFFHADPHPGNVLVTSEENLCLLDWGMVGRLTERDRGELIDLLKAVVDRDSGALLHALLRITRGGGTVDTRNLERDLLGILDSYYAVPLKNLHLGRLLLDITALLGDYRLPLPPDLVIVIKALVTAEGTARLIYPELDVFTEARIHVTPLAARRFSPKVMWRHFRTSLSAFLAVNSEIPGRFLQVLEKLDRGDLKVHLQIEEIARIVGGLENASNRLTLAVIIAALIIGSSMIVTTGVGPLLFGFPALGVIGYLISGILGLWLIFAILRTRKY